MKYDGIRGIGTLAGFKNDSVIESCGCPRNIAQSVVRFRPSECYLACPCTYALWEYKTVVALLLHQFTETPRSNWQNLGHQMLATRRPCVRQTRHGQVPCLSTRALECNFRRLLLCDILDVRLHTSTSRSTSRALHFVYNNTRPSQHCRACNSVQLAI
eukprot:6394989-Amphidinium_carterae.1